MTSIVQDLYFWQIGRNKEREREREGEGEIRRLGDSRGLSIIANSQEVCKLYTASIELELSYLSLAMATYITSDVHGSMYVEVQPGPVPLPVESLEE